MISPPRLQHPDVVIVGAGFGGLGCALSLCERGVKPLVLEALRYPGGCASTFQRDGYRFESGATLFAGLGANQRFGRWISRYQLPVKTKWLDPVVELRTPSMRLPILADRAAFVESMANKAGAKASNVRRFFALAAQVSDALWPLLDEPELLPPFSLGMMARHSLRLRNYVALPGLVGRPLIDVFRRFELDTFEPLMTWARALCQITVQCPPEEAEAPVSLSALDYPWRGTAHVVGGVGQLAEALVGAIESLGGEVRLAERVKSVARIGDGTAVGHGRFRVTTNRGEYEAPLVAANVLPGDFKGLFVSPNDATSLSGDRTFSTLESAVKTGWGAGMWYFVTKPPEGTDAEPHHLELIQNPREPFLEGNHVFVSISGADETERAPEGLRTVTVSTHVHPPHARDLSTEEAAQYTGDVQARMKATLTRLAPEWMAGVVHEMPGSPRTFARFTRRTGGYVGGIPRRANWRQYLQMGPLEPVRGAWMLGDTVFPGQSILATAVGGHVVAGQMAQRLEATRAR